MKHRVVFLAFLTIFMAIIISPAFAITDNHRNNAKLADCITNCIHKNKRSAITCSRAIIINNTCYIDPVNGTCGTANNTVLLTQPSSGLCDTGNPGMIQRTGTWTWGWTCNGIANGTTVSCSTRAPNPIDAVCGWFNGQTRGAAPPTYGQDGYAPAAFCSVGSEGLVVQAEPWRWTWTCSGQYNGKDASCSTVAPPKIDGACGSAAYNAYDTKPTTELCAPNLGTATEVTGTGIGTDLWTWTCSGQYGGNNVSCKTEKKIMPECGSAAGAKTSTAPTSNLCKTGTAGATPILIGSSWTWPCNVKNGGITCTAPYNSPSVRCNGSGSRGARPTVYYCSSGQSGGPCNQIWTNSTPPNTLVGSGTIQWAKIYGNYCN